MKDILKESIVYYIAIPVIIAMWPLMIVLHYIPNIDKKWEKEKENYTRAKSEMENILKLDQARLAYRDKKNGLGFDYAAAIVKVNKEVGINQQDCDISSKPIRRVSGRKTRNCTVIIKEIDITKFANFLSKLQITWANLQAEKITLTRKKELPDSWKADVTFTYFY